MNRLPNSERIFLNRTVVSGISAFKQTNKLFWFLILVNIVFMKDCVCYFENIMFYSYRFIIKNKRLPTLCVTRRIQYLLNTMPKKHISSRENVKDDRVIKISMNFGNKRY